MNNGGGITNIVFAGLGGMGVLKASDILAFCAYHAGLDVKKSEIHGMSQRGGSVTSDVRFGPQVFSPMVPLGEAHYLVVLDETQVAPARHMLREDGVLLTPAPLAALYGPLEELTEAALPLTARNCNVAMLGMLSLSLPFTEVSWHFALRACLPPPVHQQNLLVFALGRQIGADMFKPHPAVSASKGE